MKGATLEQNEEIVDALLGLLNSGKPVQSRLVGETATPRAC